MGVKDTITKDYMEDPYIFADVFNYWIYAGQEVIKPEKLHSLDPTEIAIPYGSKWAVTPVQKYRDKLKYLSAMTDHSAVYLLLGLEIQSEIHYAMPVKVMVYDALQYSEQVQKIVSRHSATGKNNKGADTAYTDADEYLSGFTKQDILIPVVTLVIYFGSREWDGAMSVHEMFRNYEERLLSYVPDYRINLIAPASIDDADFARFSSNLREVLSFIKYSSDKQMIDRLLDEDENFNRLEREAVDVLNACVNAKIAVKEKEERVLSS